MNGRKFNLKSLFAATAVIAVGIAGGRLCIWCITSLNAPDASPKYHTLTLVENAWLIVSGDVAPHPSIVREVTHDAYGSELMIGLSQSEPVFVYSVGENRLDESGAGDDLVYPAPASSADGFVSVEQYLSSDKL